jgi:hypothetical protein
VDSSFPTLLNRATFYRKPENKTQPLAKISLVGAHRSESIGKTATYVALDRSVSAGSGPEVPAALCHHYSSECTSLKLQAERASIGVRPDIWLTSDAMTETQKG